MSNSLISQLPTWTGTTADQGWFIYNNSGESETFKQSGYTAQYIPGTGQYSIRHFTNSAAYASGTYAATFGDPTNRVTANYGFVGGGYNNYVDGAYGATAGGQQHTSGYRCFVGGGWNNSANGNGAAIVGGESNTCSNVSGGGIFGSGGSKIYGANDTGYGIFAGYANIVSSNGSQGLFVVGGATNKVSNFRSTGDSGRYNYGGIIGGLQNYIGGNRSEGAGSSSGQNAYPLILGGYYNTILGNIDGLGDPNYYSAIINSNTCSISGASTGTTIISSQNSIAAGKTNAVLLGLSSRTVSENYTTYTENLYSYGQQYTNTTSQTGSTLTVDLSQGNIHYIEVDNPLDLTLTNLKNGGKYSILVQTTGNYTINSLTTSGFTQKKSSSFDALINTGFVELNFVCVSGFITCSSVQLTA